ncbi:uncharacterized protein BO66DRAFT_395007 [Aspergillus aculeatinus CBS 121060]|uniref:Uncharacterized protein n=1 Tax=Aspergillus aculeatinus CBS 121060 TaxID=1448322 RepID=A0ACD1GXT0_9EURO|nr:hypothetical protein BO66DRAFT_395007 [Aspergillus aculeatinus CBS 121060]RAH66004.1 hypothetical protein BO66DRAFT_395007 [Aspergillus aculeatinus CBS 121060]
MECWTLLLLLFGSLVCGWVECQPLSRPKPQMRTGCSTEYNFCLVRCSTINFYHVLHSLQVQVQVQVQIQLSRDQGARFKRG